MKALTLLLLVIVSVAHAVTFTLTAPTGPLNETELKFVGKWSGARANLKWEIIRSKDRSFELAFHEVDLNDPETLYTNYATGSWWISDGDYYFEWEDWLGDEGDFEGAVKEPIQSVSDDKIVTLTEDDPIPENIEVRVREFKLTAWEHKPEYLP